MNLKKMQTEVFLKTEVIYKKFQMAELKNKVTYLSLEAELKTTSYVPWVL